VAETLAFGETWGREAKPGLVIGLSGDLGAGKTQLVKGIARGMGVKERIASPTFALVNIYQGGGLSLYHLDLFRLDTREQILAAGLDQYFESDGVSVIEWPERWFELPPSSRGDSGASPRFRWARIETLSETSRRIHYEDFGF
jgi:tRNA threonylcarbamoyladenosine biosynthesis protein TsaE